MKCVLSYGIIYEYVLVTSADVIQEYKRYTNNCTKCIIETSPFYMLPTVIKCQIMLKTGKIVCLCCFLAVYSI
jgi:hypothetical protein